MYDHYKSYTLAFLIAGLPPMIFGILLTATRFVRKRSMEQEIKNLNEPKLLVPTNELHNEEGKHSTIDPSAKQPLLLSNSVFPNYSR